MHLPTADQRGLAGLLGDLGQQRERQPRSPDDHQRLDAATTRVRHEQPGRHLVLADRVDDPAPRLPEVAAAPVLGLPRVVDAQHGAHRRPASSPWIAASAESMSRCVSTESGDSTASPRNACLPPGRASSVRRTPGSSGSPDTIRQPATRAGESQEASGSFVTIGTGPAPGGARGERRQQVTADASTASTRYTRVENRTTSRSSCPRSSARMALVAATSSTASWARCATWRANGGAPSSQLGLAEVLGRVVVDDQSEHAARHAPERALSLLRASAVRRHAQHEDAGDAQCQQHDRERPAAPPVHPPPAGERHRAQHDLDADRPATRSGPSTPPAVPGSSTHTPTANNAMPRAEQASRRGDHRPVAAKAPARPDRQPRGQARASTRPYTSHHRRDTERGGW